MMIAFQFTLEQMLFGGACWCAGYYSRIWIESRVARHNKEKS